jgi:hypothetical protein
MTFDDLAGRRLNDGLLREILRGSAARRGADVLHLIIWLERG